jgi:hypothetical protein
MLQASSGLAPRTCAPPALPASTGFPARAHEIGRRGAQPRRIVAEQPEPGVAVVAEETPHPFRHRAMIDAERAAPRRPLADGADALLRREQPPVLRRAEPVDARDARERVTLAIGGVRSPAFAPQLIEPLAVLGAIDAVGGELVLAMRGILGISFPVLLVGEGHCASPDCAGRDRSATSARTQKAPGLALRAESREGELAYERAMGALNARRRPRATTTTPRGTTDAPMRRRCTHRAGAEAVQTHFWLVPES